MTRYRTMALLVALAGCLVAAGPALAQAPGIDPLDHISKNSGIIRIQMELGLAQEKQALQILQTAATTEDVAQMAAMIHGGYVKIRFAENGMKLRMKKYEDSRMVMDPLGDMLSERINTAMHFIREAHVHAQAAEAGDLGRIPAAVENLQIAIGHLEQVVALY
jgi:hypothetical protein